jgi:charged multivesicular body protein 3
MMYLFKTCVILFPANLRIAGALEKSTRVMQSMQQLVKVPEIMATMREMSKEMMKVSH